MNKLSKKGFTLIEMLVVIAIIAVLVAIIIPTVSSATDKAAAAANAANLRSYKAELTTALLSGDLKINAQNKAEANPGYTLPTAPTAKPVGKLEAVTAEYEYVAGTKSFTVTFSGYTIDDFAKVADGTTAPSSIAKTKA